jgi:hypothetical protein
VKKSDDGTLRLSAEEKGNHIPDIGKMVFGSVSLPLLLTKPNPIRFPAGNQFLAALPPDFTTAIVGIPSDKEYILVSSMGNALVFADWPNPAGEAFRLIPYSPGMEIKTGGKK